MICLVVLLVLCWLITTLVTFNGGMGLRQPQASDWEEDDKGKCQFTSALHAFILNRDLNTFAVKQLEKRLKLHKDEKFWRPVNMLLTDPDSEIYKKMMDTKHYFPVDVFGIELCKIVSYMWKNGYKGVVFDLYYFLLAVMSPTQKFDDTDWEKNYTQVIDSSPIKASYDTDFHLNAIQINMTDNLGNPFDANKPFPHEFYTNIYKTLKYSNFECLFITYFYGSEGGHVYAITKTEKGFTYNDDGDLHGFNTTERSDMANITMNKMLELVRNIHYPVNRLAIHFITKQSYNPDEFNDVMDKWVENVYNKLDDKFKSPALMDQEIQHTLVETLDYPEDVDISVMFGDDDAYYDDDE